MDQNAFRELLYKSASTRRADAGRPQDTQPSKQEKSGLDIKGEQAQYIDRAEARRRGIDADAVKQKGLNMKLVEEQRERMRAKAKEAEEAAKAPQTTDADLESALNEAKAAGVRSLPASGPRFQPMQTRAAESAPEAPDVIYVNGKRLRKKKKPQSVPSVPDATPAQPPSHENKHALHANTNRTIDTTARPSFAVQVDDDDADIFGEAPEWAGVQLSDDEDTRNEDCAEQELPPGQEPRRDWFSAKEPSPPAAAPEPEPEPEQAPEPEPKAYCLEGLSSSAMPSDVSRWLLEREEGRAKRDAERESHSDPRRRKRSKKGRGDIDSP